MKESEGQYKKYYCVASSNKTGRMVAMVHECRAYEKPQTKYYEALELHLDYFETRYKANKFSELLRGVK